MKGLANMEAEKPSRDASLEGRTLGVALVCQAPATIRAIALCDPRGSRLGEDPPGGIEPNECGDRLWWEVLPARDESGAILHDVVVGPHSGSPSSG